MSAKKKSPLKQLTLNFGQKSQKLTNCTFCGILYNKLDKEDVQMHDKFHSDKENVLRYTSLRGEKIVQEFSDGKCIVIEASVDSKQLLNKAIQLLNHVDVQLGIKQNDNFSDALNNSSDELNIQQAHKLPKSSKFYLFVSSQHKRIVGFCMVEQIDKAYQIEYLNANEHTFTYDETKPIKALCGISRIWVAENARRNRIASRLLDCVRINFLYFSTLKQDQIAFSDPTEFGQSLAKSYFKTNSFLIYRNTRH